MNICRFKKKKNRYNRILLDITHSKTIGFFSLGQYTNWFFVKVGFEPQISYM